MCVLSLNHVLAVFIILYDSGNRGSLRVCCRIFLAWMTSGRFSPQCWRRVPLLTGFCSKCVCQLRPQFWCLEDINKFLLISCVTGYAFGNRSGIWCFFLFFFLWVISLKVQQQLPFSKRFRMKEKFDGEGCAVFWSFCSWQIQEGWALKESSTTAEMICTFLVTPLKVHYFKGLFSNPFHGL